MPKKILKVVEEQLVIKAEPVAEAKKSHSWIMHIRSFAEKQGISYSAALKHAELKKEYVPVVKAPRSPRVKKEKAVVVEVAPAAPSVVIAAPVVEPETIIAEKKIRKPRAKKIAVVVGETDAAV
jgi:hypothetical protein